MLVLACCVVDATAAAPPHNVAAWDSSFSAPEPFSLTQFVLPLLQLEALDFGEGGNLPRPARPPDHSRGSGSNNKSAIPQKGSEVNLTLGGIDLNNSGSVVVKVDKKLLTVLFPDGRDGRAFTLKAETLEDLYEWKAALEEALALAPSATLVMGQNGIFRNDQADTFDGYVDQLKDRQPVKSLVIGRPILLALEDIDGTPSFLEKALSNVPGVKVEGILRQAAYVDDVERRIREYEQGKNDFSSEEDAHVIADCVKYVLRELPSSPVPASCCNALLETRRFSDVVAVLGEQESSQMVTTLRKKRDFVLLRKKRDFVLLRKNRSRIANLRRRKREFDARRKHS
ncbi:hypothetical protein TEA_019478 [Camellia sinensis var. sinensis]|uniref:Rho-GAP domain-containing protein n=1 Tax=Camellia sinensis var. sinensis TaxID=542762 RepID=A0A4S4EMK3_CAMSN|nr:hypothetical protein TEA_019478 [Camellia sinensis var. sinensis]